MILLVYLHFIIYINNNKQKAMSENQKDKLVLDLDICLDWIRKSGRVTKSKKGEEWIKVRVKEQPQADNFGNIFKAYVPQTKEQQAQKDSYPTTVGRGKYYAPETKEEREAKAANTSTQAPQTEEDIAEHLPF